MSSLNAVQVTAYCYVLECQARTDLPNAPASSFYVGSTSNVNMRIAQHFNGSGSRFTVAFKPIRVAELDVTPRLTAQEVLKEKHRISCEIFPCFLKGAPLNEPPASAPEQHKDLTKKQKAHTNLTIGSTRASIWLARPPDQGVV
eukprot:COSAG06_NODE_22633_length_717_cov_1.258900_2_plen_144_part_00